VTLSHRIAMALYAGIDPFAPATNGCPRFSNLGYAAPMGVPARRSKKEQPDPATANPNAKPGLKS
jgi:hypothetical protein